MSRARKASKKELFLNPTDEAIKNVQNFFDQSHVLFTFLKNQIQDIIDQGFYEEKTGEQIISTCNKIEDFYKNREYYLFNEIFYNQFPSLLNDLQSIRFNYFLEPYIPLFQSYYNVLNALDRNAFDQKSLDIAYSANIHLHTMYTFFQNSKSYLSYSKIEDFSFTLGLYQGTIANARKKASNSNSKEFYLNFFDDVLKNLTSLRRGLSYFVSLSSIIFQIQKNVQDLINPNPLSEITPNNMDDYRLTNLYRIFRQGKEKTRQEDS